MVTPASRDQDDDNAVFNIGTAARRSGLSVTTIRTWEDRYGAVVPERDDSGRRLYSNHQIAQLTWLRRQVEGGLQAAEAHRLLDLNPVALVEGEDGATATIDGAPWMAVASWIDSERTWLESMLGDLGRGLGATAAGAGPLFANPLYGSIISISVRSALAEGVDPLAPLAARLVESESDLVADLRGGVVSRLEAPALGVDGTLTIAPIVLDGIAAGIVVIVDATSGDAAAIAGQAARVIEARIDADRARSAFARLLH